MPKTKKKERSEKRKNKIWINIVLLIVTLVICLFLFEIVIRIFFPQNLNYAEFDTKFGAGYVLKSDFHATYRTSEYVFNVDTNSNGFREDKDYLYEKGNEKKRIIILGDSLVFGYTVDINESYPKQLQNILHENGYRNVEVINVGIPGYSTYKEMMYFKNELYKYNPDIVIVGLCIGNDIMANINDKESTTHTIGVLNSKKPFGEYLNLEIRKFVSSNLHSFQFVRGILISNEVIKDLFIKMGLMSKEAEFAPTETSYSPFINQDIEKDAGITKTMEFLGELREFAEQKNIRLILVAIPIREQVDASYFEDFWKQYEDCSIDAERPERYLEQFSAKEGIIYVDPLQILKEKNTKNTFYWEIDAHMNAKGYRILAEQTFEKLIKYYSFTT